MVKKSSQPAENATAKEEAATVLQTSAKKKSEPTGKEEPVTDINRPKVVRSGMSEPPVFED